MAHQPNLFDLPIAPRTPLPEGFAYQGGLITPAEELELIRRFASIEFRPYEHLGYVGNRKIAAFGWRRGERGAMVETGEGVPAFLQPLLAQVAAFAGLASDRFRHALITEYTPGAAIGWHRDRPPAEAIAGVSLLSPCAFRLRRRRERDWDRASIIAEPRSCYLMSGPVRSEWQHSIPPVEALRYSVTFRTVRS